MIIRMLQLQLRNTCIPISPKKSGQGTSECECVEHGSPRDACRRAGPGCQLVA